MVVKTKDVISFLKNNYPGIFTEEYVLKNKKVVYFISTSKLKNHNAHVIFHNVCNYFSLKVSNINICPISSINKEKKIKLELHDVLAEKNYSERIGFNFIIKEI
jgi:hypothetical protein